MLKVMISGLETIDDDINAFMPRVDKATTAGLKAVASDMKASLIQHVKDDVYAAYSPLDYERTGAMVANSAFDYDIAGGTLVFSYSFDTKSEQPYYAASDDVIAAIQDSKYLWNVRKRKIPERPFWDNFVKEQFLDGKAEASFVAGMNAQDRDLHVVANNSTTLDGWEGDDLHGPDQEAVVRNAGIEDFD